MLILNKLSQIQEKVFTKVRIHQRRVPTDIFFKKRYLYIIKIKNKELLEK